MTWSAVIVLAFLEEFVRAENPAHIILRSKGDKKPDLREWKEYENGDIRTMTDRKGRVFK
ncbi:hypothetical protein GCM10022254_27260 [Actinomadura meridiana]|uniref:Uncharacterized protein n=1 Tax=Actinomadura meridiana TaxID=559626 RepID=A0ABP8BZQ3_9ACTN